MKQVLIFIAGLVTGILLMIGIGLAAVNGQEGKAGSNVPEFFNEPGDCLGSYKFEIFQALKDGYGLSYKLEKSEYTGDDRKEYSTIYLFYNPNLKPFYDGQVIEIPRGACARQVGIYKYESGDQTLRTVPVVQIMKK